MTGRVIQPGSSESPLTSLEDSPVKRTASKKRQRIESDDDVGLEDEAPVQAGSKPRRVAPTFSSDDDEEHAGSSQAVADDAQPSSSTGRLRRRASTASSAHEAPVKPRSKKMKGKAKAEGPPKKRKKKAPVADDFASEVSDEFEDPDVEMELEEEEGFVEPSDGEEPKSKGKGRGGGRVTKKGAAKELGAKEILIKAKDESSRAPIPAKGKPATRTAATADEMEVDVVGGASSPLPQPDGPEASPLTPAVAPKKRKLPTIKKVKAVDSAGPSTPVTKDVLSNIKSGSTGARKPAAYVGVSDLNLNNADIYTELFSKKGPNASRSNTREESKKKIETMRAEWKAKREAELMQAPPFDLQAQQEKLARFEEKLRSARSAALYPNFLAGKWREIWERERNRAREHSASQDGRPSVNGVTPNGREPEEGEHTG